MEEEVYMGNCYKVQMGDRPFAVVKTEQAAINLINLMIWHAQASNEQAPQMSYKLAYIENIGF